jgi:hypothetical protein
MLPAGFGSDLERPAAGGEQRVVAATAAARVTLLAATVILHDHGHVEAYERSHIGCERAVGRLHEHDLVDTGDACDHLRDAVVHGANALIEIGEQRDFIAVGHAGERIAARIEGSRAHGARRDLVRTATLGSGDAARREHRIGQCRFVQLIGIGEARALARDCAHADALIDAVSAFLDDAVLDGPGLVARQLQIEIDIVELPHHRRRQRPLERRELETGALEQQLARDRERIGGSHCGLRRGRHQ